MASAAAAIAACATVGPNYVAPEPEAPADFVSQEGARVSAGAVGDARWWQSIGDATLASLVERALLANPDARIAAARVLEARAGIDEAAGQALPQIGFDALAARRRVSPNGPEPLPPGTEPEQSVLHSGFVASWDLDLFGRIKREVEAARADLGAIEADRDAVLVSLSGDVGKAYIDLLGSRRELDALASDERSALDTLGLTQSRRRAGLATDLDVARAEAELASIRSFTPERRAAESRALYRLAILVGEAPGSLDKELASARALPAPPPKLAVGIPASLLRRRPDVRRAERALAAETARIGVATADLYPDVSLSAAFGLDATNFPNFFKWDSRSWSIGPSLRWPVFAGGRIEARIAAQNARAKAAAAAFDRAVLNALADVETAMTSYLRAWDRRDMVRTEVDADRRAVALARDVQRAGGGTFLDVLDAERRMYEAEVRLAESEAAVVGDLIALYTALAGGWDSPAEELAVSQD
jgi:NodT family efflux transporter outer membrane factor (OMF) lipoprotein